MRELACKCARLRDVHFYRRFLFEWDAAAFRRRCLGAWAGGRGRDGLPGLILGVGRESWLFGNLFILIGGFIGLYYWHCFSYCYFLLIVCVVIFITVLNYILHCCNSLLAIRDAISETALYVRSMFYDFFFFGMNKEKNQSLTRWIESIQLS